MNKLLTSAIMGLLTVPAFAIPNPIPTASELPDFDQFGVNIQVPSFEDRVIYKFTPDEPGILTVLTVSKSSDIDLFVSEIYDSSNYTVTPERWLLGTFSEDVPEGYNFAYEYSMTPDQVFYISIPLTSFNATSEVKFLWEAVEVNAAAITSILPNPTGDFYYDYLNEQNIVVTADGPMSSFGEVTISYLDETVTIQGNRKSGPTNGEFLTIATADPGATNYVIPAVESGAEVFTITVKDYKVNGVPVTSNETGNPNVVVEDGTVSFSYKITQAPKYLADQSSWPSTFYASWEAGDTKGMATLVFDQPISFVGEATLIMAAYNIGETGGEIPARTYPLPTIVDGNKVTIDFTGQNFVGSSDKVTVLMLNVRGVNGLPATFNGYATAMAQQIDFVNEAAPENPDVPSKPEYMEGVATQVNHEISEAETALEILWPETVYMQDTKGLEIPVYHNEVLVGNLSSTYINLVKDGNAGPANATRAESGESGTVMYVLLGASGLLEGPGTYTVIIPEGMVANADGQINKPQDFEVVYVAQPEGVISPESGTIFGLGEDVVITITYDALVEINYSEDAPVIVSNYADYDESLEWEADVLYIEGNAIVINLGNELTPGYYYLSLREAQVLVGGVSNAPIYDYMFQVAEGESGINTVGTSEGENNVYNLNGVKVNQNNLKAGVYIINGKKVVVK